MPPSAVEYNVQTYLELCEQIFAKGAEARLHAPHMELQSELEQFIAAVLEEHATQKQRLRVLEYNDLETYALELLKLPEVRQKYRQRFQHFFVDEFQDTSRMQCELVHLLCGESKPLFVVGDEKQSIYRFRGAEVEVFKEFVDQMPHHQRLSTNFRSQAQVIEAVNSVCGEFMESYAPMQGSKSASSLEVPELAAVHPKVAHVIAPSDAEGVFSILKKLQAQGIPWSNAVLLLRRLKGNEKLFEDLNRLGVGLALTSSSNAASDENLTKLLNLWIWSFEPWQELRAARVMVDFNLNARDKLKEGLRELRSPFKNGSEITCEQALATLNRLFKLAENFGSVFEQFKVFILNHHEEGVLPGHLARTLHRLLESEGDVRGFTLEPPPANLSQSLRVMTVHASKGLQFPVVLLADLKNRRKPSSTLVRAGRDFFLPAYDEDGKPIKDTEEIKNAVESETRAEREESLRLLYVAMTRAQDALFAIDCEETSHKADSWGNWLAAGIENHVQVQGESAEQSSKQGLKKPKPPTEKHRESFSLFTDPVHYSRARTGVTKLLSESVEPPEFINRSKNKKARTFDPRIVGTEVHAFLEHRDWEGLARLEKTYGLDLDPFWDWLKTSSHAKAIFASAEKQSTVGKVFPEFAFEWKSKDQGIVAGRIDTLVVFEDEAWIIDFKTVFKKCTASELLEKYKPQIDIYMRVVKSLLPHHTLKGYLIDLLASTGEVCLKSQ